jgi:hypothetical protein
MTIAIDLDTHLASNLTALAQQGVANTNNFAHYAIMFNSTGSPMSFGYGGCTPGGQAGTGTLPANSTVVVVWLHYTLTCGEDAVGDVDLCRIYTQSGWISCPFGPVLMTEGTSQGEIGGKQCDFSGTSVAFSLS